jgi:hypothetical protein
MTTNQLIALLFPIGTAAACGLFGIGLKLWLDHKYPATEQSIPLRPEQASLTTGSPEISKAFMQVHELLDFVEEKVKRERA